MVRSLFQVRAGQIEEFNDIIELTNNTTILNHPNYINSKYIDPNDVLDIKKFQGLNIR